MERLTHLPADVEISLKREISVAAPFKKSLTHRNSQVFPSLSYAIRPLNITQTSALHLQEMSWQSKLQKLLTLEKNNLPESIPARSLLLNALWRMVCYMFTVYSTSLTTKPCTHKSCMHTMTTLEAGHPGRAATYELVSQKYWWPGIRKTIAR